MEITSRYGRDFVRGVVRYSRANGPWTFYAMPGEKRDTLFPPKKWHAEGIITNDASNQEKILAMNLPTIITVNDNKPSSKFYSVIVNTAEIVEIAYKHLHDRGFKHFAYCGFDDNRWWSLERGEAFIKRCSDAGFKAHLYHCAASVRASSWEQRINSISKWLKSLPIPMGLMVCSDEWGRYVIQACRSAGLYIPNDIAIIGVDNDDIICELCDPPLSSINLNCEKAGYEAAQLLDELLRGVRPTRTQITVSPTHVVERRSSDVLAITDPQVKEAVRFIYQNRNRSISVDEIVYKTAVSRRSLERRFHQSLGRSIYDEIKHARVESIIKMLIDTDLPVSQIATALGFNAIEHVSRFFKNETGISPLVYRKKYSPRRS